MKRKEIITTLKRLGWATLILASAAIVVSAIERKDGSLASEVHVEIEPLQGENLLISQQDVLLIIERSFGHQVVGMPIASIDAERLETVLEEDPFIRDADVYVDTRSEVHVDIEQREPVLRIIDEHGQHYYLDQDGVQMPLSKHFTSRVLVATGAITPYVEDFRERDPYNLKDIFSLAEALRKDAFTKALIEQIYVPDNGKLIMVPKVGDQKIVLGDISDLEDKLERLRIFYEEVTPYEGWRKYKSINLEYDQQVVCLKH